MVQQDKDLVLLKLQLRFIPDPGTSACQEVAKGGREGRKEGRKEGKRTREREKEKKESEIHIHEFQG